MIFRDKLVNNNAEVSIYRYFTGTIIKSVLHLCKIRRFIVICEKKYLYIYLYFNLKILHPGISLRYSCYLFLNYISSKLEIKFHSTKKNEYCID